MNNNLRTEISGILTLWTVQPKDKVISQLESLFKKHKKELLEELISHRRQGHFKYKNSLEDGEFIEVFRIYETLKRD